jgi:hypothetical protein
MTRTNIADQALCSIGVLFTQERHGGTDGWSDYGVFRGDRAATWGTIQVLPVMEFLKRLWDGEILG